MAPSKLSPVQMLTAPIRLAKSPWVTGPLLLAILYQPEKLQSIVSESLYPFITSPAFIRTLKIFLGISIVSKLNRKLSQLSANNWKSDAKFIKSQELVLITGGSSGIGELMARDFSKAGVKVVILDVNPPKSSLPSNIHFFKADVTSSSQIASVASEIRKTHGDPTVLINNAGVANPSTILDSSEEGFRKVFEVNTIAHFVMVREFLPAMIKKNHGHVVTIASMASFVVIPQSVDYACTKASALAFHEGLSVELRVRYNAPNVRTTVVHPTWIRTPLIEVLTSSPDFKDTVLEPEDVVAPIVNQVLSGRSGQLFLPEELKRVSGIRGFPTWLQNLLRNTVAARLTPPSFKERSD